MDFVDFVDNVNLSVKTLLDVCELESFTVCCFFLSPLVSFISLCVLCYSHFLLVFPL